MILSTCTCSLACYSVYLPTHYPLTQASTAWSEERDDLEAKIRDLRAEMAEMVPHPHPNPNPNPNPSPSPNPNPNPHQAAPRSKPESATAAAPSAAPSKKPVKKGEHKKARAPPPAPAALLPAPLAYCSTSLFP